MIVNGTLVEGSPKQVEFPIKGEVVKLVMAVIPEGAVVDCTFKWIEAPEGVEITGRKMGGLVSNEFKKDSVVIFDSLAGSSVFTVLEKAFGWSVATSKRVYAKSNPMRKESQTATKASVVITEAGALG